MSYSHVLLFLYNLFFATAVYKTPTRRETPARREESEIENRIQIAHIKQVIVQVSACTKTVNRNQPKQLPERSEGKKKVSLTEKEERRHLAALQQDGVCGLIKGMKAESRCPHTVYTVFSTAHEKTHYTLTHTSTCLLCDEEISMVKLIHTGMFASDMKPDGLSDLSPLNSKQRQGTMLEIGRAISLS